MVHHGHFMSIVSKNPIRVYEDRDCLNQLDLSEDESDFSSSDANGREKASVSRTFYQKYAEAAYAENKSK